MGFDTGLAAAVTLQRQHGLAGGCAASDSVFQLTLANVLLDGGYDAVATLGDVLPSGDHGLGTLDRLDGELVVVDGEPWRVDSTGLATLMPATARTPFVVLTTMESPVSARVRDMPREDLPALIERLAGDLTGVVAVRVEGRFSRVLVRSVPPQDPPYRPYAEVCATDEVRWEHLGFEGVFVGFCFPDLGSGDTIAGLHLHGLDTGRTTGGHNHEMLIEDAQVTVSTTRDIALALPDRSMVDMLEVPKDLRAVERVLLRRGALTVDGIAAALGISEQDAAERLEWLADRGFVQEWDAGLGGLGGPPRWHVALHTRRQRLPARVADVLWDL